jgi:hypothetical protein
MNKIVIGCLFLAVAIGLCLFILLKGRSPFGKGNSSFASEPQKEITRIELSEGSRRLSLQKEGEKWTLNGKLETRKSGILLINRVLREIRIKSPVSEELFEKEIIAKKITPLKVKVYEKRKLLSAFMVYKTPSNSYGNIMKIKEGSKPFIVYVPGFDGDIGSIFTINDLFWQPYAIFNFMPSEIASVNFENFSDTSSSFSIISKNHHYVFVPGTDRYKTGLDSTLVTRYLSYFAWIPFEAWALEIDEKEKKMIESELPLYRISVNTTTGNKTILTLWQRMTGENGSKTIDSDRLLGKTEAINELFVLRYFDIDPLIKKRSYFYPE